MAAAGRWRAGLAVLAVALGLGGAAAEQTEEHLKREHSLSKPYQGVGSASSGLWDLLGNAMVMTQFIRLTPDVQSKHGAVWNRVVSGAPGERRGRGDRHGPGRGLGVEGNGERVGRGIPKLGIGFRNWEWDSQIGNR
uniref:VIP36-like protein n=1 Tax=Lonchura striata TaxID=40157 RepID=UPI000B4DB4A7